MEAKLKGHYGQLIMLFFYRKGKNATEAANNICVVYGKVTLGEKTVRRVILIENNANSENITSS